MASTEGVLPTTIECQSPRLKEASIDAIRDLRVELRERYGKKWRLALGFATKDCFEGNVHLPPRNGES